MRTYFIIKEGNLVFTDNRIEINDKKRWAWMYNIFLPITVILTGISNIRLFYKSGGTEFYLLWIGVFLIVGMVVGLIINSKRNFDRQIEIENIEKVIIERDLSDMLIANFKLKSGGKRKVLLDFDRYSSAEFELTLKEHNILTDID